MSEEHCPSLCTTKTKMIIFVLIKYNIQVTCISHINITRALNSHSNTTRRQTRAMEALQYFHWVVVLLASLISPLASLWSWSKKRAHLVRMGFKFPGPLAIPLLGNVLDAGRFGSAESFKAAMTIFPKYGAIFRFYLGPYLLITSVHANDNERFLSGYKYLNKSYLYNKFLESWLGTGLLISSGEKWRWRRKALTPAFHFRILEQFGPVFLSCGDEFVRQLRRRADGSAFDVCPLVKLLTLDVISETAMGVKMNAQLNSNSAYVNAVEEITNITFQRIFRPWFHIDFIFFLSTMGRRYKECLEILHGTTSRVIRERREELLKMKENMGDIELDIDEVGRRRRVAFLDLLLLAARDGRLSDSDIREEVDTFMFEGHDTISSAISFTIYLLSRHPNVQEKVYDELMSVFDVSKPLQPTLGELSELKYLEMVIKESLRIYPPVGLLFRDITEDEQLPTTGHVMPGGTFFMVSPLNIHRNPEVFPDPEKFDPERFTPEESARRHPYAYLPFSAGPRNCIGQRFAMLEMKSLLAKVVWNFRILPEPGFEVVLCWHLITKSYNGVKIRLQERH